MITVVIRVDAMRNEINPHHVFKLLFGVIVLIPLMQFKMSMIFITCRIFQEYEQAKE
jgi:hypothetical protein